MIASIRGGIRAEPHVRGQPPSRATSHTTTWFNVQPFNNVMTVKTMTGAQIEQLLEQAWCGTNLTAVKFLQVSAGFTYTYDGAGLT